MCSGREPCKNNQIFESTIVVVFMKKKFKEKLFETLYEATKVKKQNPLFIIGRNVLDCFDGKDLRTFMDDEMRSLAIVRPYLAYYVEQESDADKLAFLDIAPVVVDHGSMIDIVYNYYDANIRCVKQYVVRSILK